MRAVLIAAIGQLLQAALPVGLKWLAGQFTKLFDKFLAADPAETVGLDAVAGAAASGTDQLADAPDALKEWLRQALARFTDGIDRPLLKRAFALVADFLVNHLADALWDRLFPSALGGKLLAAPGGVHWSAAGAFESSLLKVQTDGRGTFTEAVLFPEPPADAVPEPESTPDGGTGPGPELVFDTPPTPESPAAPVVTDPAPPATPPAGDF